MHDEIQRNVKMKDLCNWNIKMERDFACLSIRTKWKKWNDFKRWNGTWMFFLEKKACLSALALEFERLKVWKCTYCLGRKL